MKIPLILILVLSTLTIKAQQLSRTNIASSGNFCKDNQGISINWTMGNIFAETIQEKQHLTGGFQQGALNKLEDSRQAAKPTPIPKTSNENQVSNKLNTPQSLAIIAFPNPTPNQLSLKFAKPISGIAMIFDNTGKKLFQEKTNASADQPIDLPQVEQLRPGIYFIHIYQGKQKMISKSFVKI